MIGSSENSISYNGNGTTTAFPFSFKILQKSDLKLLRVTSEGIEEPITKDYFVDLTSNVVHYPGYSPGNEPPVEEQPDPIAEGDRLVLYRDVPITQESALDEHWPFNVIEDMADKLTIICQQIAGANKRAFQLSITLNNLSEIDLSLPYAPNKSFAWNADGTGLVLTENPADVLPMVQQEVSSLREFILEKEKELQEIVDTLDSLKIEELENIRDQALEAARIAEEAARSNTNMVISDNRDRAGWKYNYGVEKI